VSRETFLYAANIVLPAAAHLLPEKLNAPAAQSMLLAIGLQESQFFYRTQVAGIARGFWQFEPNGVRAVLRHTLTRPIIEPILDRLCYPKTVEAVYQAITHHDPLACVMARLLMWSSPLELPGADDPQAGWTLYVDNWRPGRPRRSDWNENFRRAWDPVGVIDA
jgi:hypothetical protein